MSCKPMRPEKVVLVLLHTSGKAEKKKVVPYTFFILDCGTSCIVKS